MPDFWPGCGYRLLDVGDQLEGRRRVEGRGGCARLRCGEVRNNIARGHIVAAVRYNSGFDFFVGPASPGAVGSGSGSISTASSSGSISTYMTSLPLLDKTMS